jgi:hypothetical protein
MLLMPMPPIEFEVKPDIPAESDEPMLREPNDPVVIVCPQASNPYPAKRINTKVMDLNFMISTPGYLVEI